ncbi:MAG: PQQ-binding-like beta-propeller repeat protein [Tepidisphaerales bacterium]
MMKSKRPWLLSLCMLILGPAAVSADDWPQFRGPTGDGIAQTKNLPLTWSPTQNIAWKAAVPGRGRSSPVILGDRIWLTTAIESRVRRFGSGADDMQQAQRVVLGAVCLERASGKILWNVEVFPWDNPGSVHWLNSYATPTPVVEPGRLYCDFGTFGTACLDSNSGQVIWKRRLPVDHQVGPGSSPILYKNLLVLVRDGRDQQYVTALDKQTGDPVWRTDRPPISSKSGDMRKSFSTPLVIEAAERTQMVVPGAQWIVSYEPETGREIWRVNDGSGFSGAPRPVYGQGMVYICTGNTGGSPQLWAIRVDGKGDVTRTHVAWKLTTQIPMVPSPVLVGQAVYLINDDGFASCVDALSGKVLGKRRVGGKFCASPVYAEGRLYLCDQDGKITVLAADTQMSPLAENQVDGPVFASPAAVGSSIYLRSDGHLYCIRVAPARGAD